MEGAWACGFTFRGLNEALLSSLLCINCPAKPRPLPSGINPKIVELYTYIDIWLQGSDYDHHSSHFVLYPLWLSLWLILSLWLKLNDLSHVAYSRPKSKLVNCGSRLCANHFLFSSVHHYISGNICLSFIEVLDENCVYKIYQHIGSIVHEKYANELLLTTYIIMRPICQHILCLETTLA